MEKRMKNDKGMALISVMIIITLLAIMSGTILQMSYLAYTRKITEKRSNETFYTAESMIDTIKAAVQNQVSTEITKAKDGTEVFINSAADVLDNMDLYDYLWKQIVFNSDGSLKYDNEYFTYRAGETGTSLKAGLTSKDAGGFGGEFTIGTGEDIARKPGDPVTVVRDVANKRVVIKDVKIRFVNKMGYVAEISTDIVVNAPVYAADITVPVGSYSMFAGSGASIGGNANTNFNNNQMNMGIYLHQEGNVYFGLGNSDSSGRMGSLFLTTQSSSKGGIFFSVGGTNAVFNGDVYVDTGNVLMFTGGDGKEDAYVQVNGYIYMTKGATLLLANNVHLVCKGISVRESTSGSYQPYTGSGTLTKNLSQFYPVDQNYASSKANTEYNNYLENKIDIHQVLNKVKNGDLPSGSSALDTRAYNCASNSPEACGVYILSGDRSTSTGWKHSSTDQYYLVTKSGNTYKVAKTGLYNDNIRTIPDDTKLNTEDNVWYGEQQVDAEFARIINMPIIDLMNFDTNQYLGTWFFTDYNASKASTYTKVKYSDLKYALISNNLSSISNQIIWDDVAAGLQNNDGSVNIPMSDRTLRKPNKTSQDNTLSKSSAQFTITTTDGRKYVAGQLAVGITQGSNCVVNATGINGDNYGYYIAIAECPVELHVGTEPYVGMFLSASEVNMGQSTGVCRGISLLEMAKHTSNPGLDKENNPVRKMLETLSGAAMNNPTNSKIVGYANMSSNALFDGIVLFDNVFNGGVPSLWETKTSSSGGSNNDNSDLNFVDVDNWDKE